ncbi:hypothetical protein ACFQZO_23500 [Bradyrhizobium sp. GCM10027634]|uniref:hypothetical protein n=1 Tax=unclassified Bradyrhizobium TaxID=2631580 RepID=UPI00263B080E|nr:hypothetical protein [Bradyrhizobium sp. WYCCWR 12677]MDN5003806.1 hypothetical protein [Bradyrhizobium sp. WYCCWR 12677]
MRALFLTFLTLTSLIFSPAVAQRGVSAPDPYTLDETGIGPSNVGGGPSHNVGSLTLRSQTTNPAQRTLVLIIAGQSNAANVVPTRVAPTNASVIDQINVYDGAIYSVRGDMVGCSNDDTHGNMNVQLADKFISGGQFDRVIIGDVSISTTTISQWSTGTLSTRVPVLLRRLAARGITPASTNVTFAFLWQQGESDTGTTQLAYQTGFGVVQSNIVAAGFSGRIFVAKETLLSNTVNATIQAAQVALVNNITIWSAGDLDALTGANRQGDGTHWSDTGAPNAATALYNAMHASGTPY